jgi:hypothetical protein
MKGIVLTLIAVAAVAGGFACIGPAYGQVNREAAPTFVDKILPGIPRLEVDLCGSRRGKPRFAAVLGNDVAIKAYRTGTHPEFETHSRSEFSL